MQAGSFNHGTAEADMKQISVWPYASFAAKTESKNEEEPSIRDPEGPGETQTC